VVEGTHNKNMLKCDILHIISGDLWAGAEVQIFHTLNNLKKRRDLSVFVILFNGGILSNKLNEIGIRTAIIDENSVCDLLIVWKIRKIIKQFKPKILHVHAYKEHLLGRLAVLFSGWPIKIIRTFHGMSDVPQFISFLKKVKSTLIHFIEKRFLDNRHLYIIAVSKELEKFLKSNYPNSVVIQIHNGIYTPESKAYPIAAIRKKYNIAKDIFWIGTLARLAEPKNLDMLIDVGKNLKEIGINYKISIFGTGPLKNHLENSIISTGLENLVNLEGFESDIYPLLKSFDLFVLTSSTEGLPMSLLEAMSMATAVVSTNVGGINEVIKNNYSGILVDNGRTEDFTNAIIKLYHDPELRKVLACHAADIIDKSFSIEKTNKDLVRLYSSILNQS
jgi:glycosyltransferase involved in cell wall biosynthesis